MATPNREKGARYLASLDRALCNGSWNEVPELARKTDKHAPERKCLTLTARSEYGVASASTASDPSSGLESLIDPLKGAIAKQSQYEDDVFCAAVCLAQIYMLRGDHDSALQTLPSSSPQRNKEGEKHATIGWLEVCEAKSAYIRVTSLEATGQSILARDVYVAVTKITPGSRTPELRRWVERTLALTCTHLASQTGPKGAGKPSIDDICRSLIAFRAWADFWERAPLAGATTGKPDIARRRVWRDYYELLSTILDNGLVTGHSHSTPVANLVVPPESVASLSPETFLQARRAQVAELKKIESTYESLLLNETQFPKANQSNAEVESFCVLAFQNFRALASSNFPVSVFVDRTKEILGRGMLDVLFRAATKTFHSTAILRMLFHTHAWLGEFDLSLAAFDSYVDIVSKSKDRAEKTQKHELGFDDDDSAIQTVAEAIKVLVNFGDREQAEKAMELVKVIEKWLERARPASSSGWHDTEAVRTEKKPDVATGQSQLKASSIVAALGAIGTATVHWARLTYNSPQRSLLQKRSMEHFEKAQTFDPARLDIAYSLAISQVESRDVTSAIRTIQDALARAENVQDSELGPSPAEEQRSILPLWHLLALCLSARDQYEAALEICENTIEAQHTPEMDIMGMEWREKEQLLELYLTNLSLVEAAHGVEEAITRSNEVLALYARLFGSPAKMAEPVSPPPTSASAAIMPKSRGTLRSIAGSIAGRSRSRRNSFDDSTFRGSVISAPGTVASIWQDKTQDKAQTQPAATNGNGNVGVPIEITVTSEDGPQNQPQHPNHHHRLPFGHKHHHSASDSVRSRSLDSRQSRNTSRNRRSTNPVPPPSGNTETVDHAEAPVGPALQEANMTAQPAQPLKKIEHNIESSKLPPPPGHSDQPPQQDVRLPAPHPVLGVAPALPQYASLMRRRHAISVLVNVWLFIAGLYLRANSLDDCSDAVNEAGKLVDYLEQETFRIEEGTNARRLYFKRWGLGKSVDFLSADVWSARGSLAISRSQPFKAMEAYEQALLLFPDHAEATVGVSELLMQIYDQSMPAEEPKPLLPAMPSDSNFAVNLKETEAPPQPQDIPIGETTDAQSNGEPLRPTDTYWQGPNRQEPSHQELNRLACRDRAYMLLSNLTKSGAGWDNSEAWSNLARAHELSGEVHKARRALWWVVELEQNRPIRDLREALPDITA